MELDTIINKIISLNPEINRQEIIERIKNKKIKSGNFLTDETAARIIASDLGVKIVKSSIEFKIQIKDLISGLNDVSLIVKLISIFPPKTFKRKDWTEGKVTGYRYRNARIEPISGSIKEKPSDSVKNLKLMPPSSTSSTITVPLNLRDIQLGEIILTIDNPGHSDEIKSLVTDISERLALALENARLIESAQQRASQEQLISQITTKMRETLDLETILKTTAEEIQTSLQLPEVIIRLGDPLTKSGSGS